MIRSIKHLLVAVALTATVTQADYSITDMSTPNTTGLKILFSVESGTAYYSAVVAPGEHYELVIANSESHSIITETAGSDRFLGVENDTYAYHVSGSPGIYLNNGTETINIAPTTSIGWKALSLSNGQAVFATSDGSDSEIYLYDGTELIQITDNETNDYAPQISNGHIVWLDYSNDFSNVFSWKDGVTTQITSGVGAMDPTVDGDLIVWSQYIVGAQREVFTYKNGITTNISNSPLSDENFVVSNGTIAWRSKYEAGGHPPYNWMYWELNVFDGTTVKTVTTQEETVYDFQIDNGQVVFQAKPKEGGNYNVYHYNGTVVNQITNNTSAKKSVQIDGAFIGWVESEYSTILVKVAEYTEWDSQATYTLTALHSGKALDGAGGNNGSNVQQWDLHGELNQQWKILATAFGHRFENAASGKVLDVAQWSTENGGNVHQWDWVDGLNQQWVIDQIENGSYVIMNVLSGKVLDVSEYAYWNGASVHQWDYVGEANQQWNINKVVAE